MRKYERVFLPILIMLLLVTAVSLIYAEEGKMETPNVAESTSESEESNSENQ